MLFYIKQDGLNYSSTDLRLIMFFCSVKIDSFSPFLSQNIHFFHRFFEKFQKIRVFLLKKNYSNRKSDNLVENKH